MSVVVALDDAEGDGVRSGGLFRGDDAVVDHHREDERPAHRRAVGVPPRGVAARVLWKAREQSGLREVEFGRGNVVQVLGGRLDTVCAVSEVDLVEVELDDPVLRVRLLDAQGEERLLELARQADLLREEEAARELLRDRAGSLDHVPGPDVGDASRGVSPYTSTPQCCVNSRSSVAMMAFTR